MSLRYESFPGYRKYPDGREVCERSRLGQLEYEKRRNAMFKRQKGLCGLCGEPISGGERAATFDHEDGRGMGGAHRDDRIEKDGKPYNCAAHLGCNYLKGSRRKKLIQ